MVFLPADYAEHLDALVRQQPTIMIHADIGLTVLGTYLNWSLLAAPGKQPVTSRKIWPSWGAGDADFWAALEQAALAPANITPSEAVLWPIGRLRRPLWFCRD